MFAIIGLVVVRVVLPSPLRFRKQTKPVAEGAVNVLLNVVITEVPTGIMTFMFGEPSLNVTVPATLAVIPKVDESMVHVIGTF